MEIRSGVNFDVNRCVIVAYKVPFPILINKLKSGFVKIAVDPKGDSRVEPQITLTMSWPN